MSNTQFRTLRQRGARSVVSAIAAIGESPGWVSHIKPARAVRQNARAGSKSGGGGRTLGRRRLTRKGVLQPLLGLGRKIGLQDRSSELLHLGENPVRCRSTNQEEHRRTAWRQRRGDALRKLVV